MNQKPLTHVEALERSLAEAECEFAALKANTPKSILRRLKEQGPLPPTPEEEKP